MLVLALTMLSGCKTSSVGNGIALSAIDGACEVEFNRLVQIHRVRAFNKQDVVDLVVRLDKSQKAKSRCGRAMIARVKALAGVD